MNQLKGKNNTNQSNLPHIRSNQLETMPSLENNIILSDNDEYCYELEQSTYSKNSIKNSNKSNQSNNSNTIQMISELSDLNINNEQHIELPLKYINHLPIDENKKETKKDPNINNYKMNLDKKKKIFDIENNIDNNNSENNSKNYSYNYEMNELNINNNNQNNNNNLDNEWDIPKITFSEISQVSKAMSSEGNELMIEKEEFDSNNNINSINMIKENLKIKKKLIKNQKEHESDNDNNLNYLIHKKNIDSKLSTEDACRTINLLSSQYSNMDFLKQTINNCLLKSGYRDIVDNSQKFLTKSSSFDYLNEYSNAKPENEKIKKNLIMQMVLFNNMKNEMEILKKKNEGMNKRIYLLKKELINYEKKKEEISNENNKRMNEINYLRNKIKKYKNYYKDYELLKSEHKTIIKKNEQLIKNNGKMIYENEKLKEELIQLKKYKRDSDNENYNYNDKEKKEFINKINQLTKENKNLNEFINKQKLNIINLENIINDKNIDISNCQETIKILQHKNDSKANSKQKAHKNKSTQKDELNKQNEEKRLKNLLISQNEAPTKNEKSKNILNKKNNKLTFHNNKHIKNIQNNQIEYYNNKLQEKKIIIEKLQSDNLILVSKIESIESQMKELLEMKTNYDELEKQNNDLKNEINDINIKYTELIEENNKSNNKKQNNLIEQIDKLNIINNQIERELNINKQKLENISKKLFLSYNTLINFAKKIKIYASKEFQKNTMNLFLKGFKELIEKLNKKRINDNQIEIGKEYELESIYDFINLIPLEIEILYKKILTLQNDSNNSNNMNCCSLKKNNLNNKEKIENINKNNLNQNAFSDFPQNKKISKYKPAECNNNMIFRNKEIKIKKLNITDLANSGSNSTKKEMKNSKINNHNLDTQKNNSLNKNNKKYITNLYSETIKNSKCDNFKRAPIQKINSFTNCQFNNEYDKKGGINLKKFSFNQSEEDKNNNNSVTKKDINNNKESLSSRGKITKELNDNKYHLSKKAEIKNSKNDVKNYNINRKTNGNNNERIDFKSVRNKILNNEFKLKNSVKKKPQKLLFLNNDINDNNNTINIKEKLFHTEIFSIGSIDAERDTQKFAYKKKILHKINNFSVNIKEGRKNTISFNSSINSAKKKNNSFLFY